MRKSDLPCLPSAPLRCQPPRRSALVLPVISRLTGRGRLRTGWTKHKHVAAVRVHRARRGAKTALYKRSSWSAQACCLRFAFVPVAHVFVPGNGRGQRRSPHPCRCPSDLSRLADATLHRVYRSLLPGRWLVSPHTERLHVLVAAQHSLARLAEKRWSSHFSLPLFSLSSLCMWHDCSLLKRGSH